MLTPEERKAIIKFRIEKAYKSLNEAKAVAALGFWNLCGGCVRKSCERGRKSGILQIGGKIAYYKQHKKC